MYAVGLLSLWLLGGQLLLYWAQSLCHSRHKICRRGEEQSMVIVYKKFLTWLAEFDTLLSLVGSY
jgi:hypothetical protein